MTETLVDVPGALLCAETFGNPADPAILLIGGIAGAMDWWHSDFCRALADGGPPGGASDGASDGTTSDGTGDSTGGGAAARARRSANGGRFVVRYDHRDTGRSRTDPPGAPSYTGDDLALDPVRLLDALGIGQAHLAGVSMGGGIAQQAAIEHRRRVASLTLISTSPVTRVPGAPRLPGPTAVAQAQFQDPPPDPDWGDPEEVVRYLVAGEQAFAGPGYDELAALATARRVVRRSIDPAAAANHYLVESRPVRGSLADVAVPTLVLHGDADPLFPPEHGAALAAAIEGARFVLLPGVGHQYPPRAAWDVVVPEIRAISAPA